MADPLLDVALAGDALRQVAEAAGPYLDSLAGRPVLDHDALGLLAGLGGALPESGAGTAGTVARLVDIGTAAGTASSGPRFYHLVIGGVTPAALAADWLASLLDQNAYGRVSSPFATEVETVAVGWLRELFGLSTGWGGALVASATFANFTGLGCATQWWGERHGADTVSDGLAGLPRMPVLSTPYVHASARKALQMLGHGRNAVHTADLAGIRRRLDALDGQPAVLIGNAGEVNTGDFDPIAAMADLAADYGCWLHVDGAFGLFAALSPRTEHLVAGIERADSIAADAHKWLNVPYESGFALIKDPDRLGTAYGMPGAPYLPPVGDPAGGHAMFGPESSRRARALPIWATLAAYGRDGYRAMVERHLDLAQHLKRLVDDAPELERLAEVPLCIVCFRARPEGVPEEGLDEFNRRLGAAIVSDGRFLAGLTVHEGRVALRPAIVNWRTTASDIDLFVTTVRELVVSTTG
ncbi:glutamate/tyrosine decarboxylase-like PLP-dependent enzyme [Actinoplanes tereljensis]|uniref:Aspartate aminotransferase family protein n=1 Tax=Paractinoplanes tereljensis TaxID=571912 RepID=A0A919NPI7_9ACTN|nr:pyridoxal-dependent decarboxylase [Actinoplanes tereljensis]GIF22689.1 aspartate aminotransferase family protein [Actinoplanes tereljensis]